jgi:hypothetical protein
MTTLTIAMHFEVNGLRISDDLVGTREEFYFLRTSLCNNTT